MTHAILVMNLEDVALEAVRAGTEEPGAVQVVNHGVPSELSEDLGRTDGLLRGGRHRVWLIDHRACCYWYGGPSTLVALGGAQVARKG